MKITLLNKEGYSIHVTGLVPYWTGVKITGELRDPKGNVIELAEIDVQMDEVKAILSIGQRIKNGEMNYDELLQALMKAVFNALKGAFAVALVGKKEAR